MFNRNKRIYSSRFDIRYDDRKIFSQMSHPEGYVSDMTLKSRLWYAIRAIKYVHV